MTPYDNLSRVVELMKSTPYLLSPDTDREEVVKIGKKMASGNSRITTILNFTWAAWYDSIPKVNGWKKGCVYEVFGGDTLKSKSELTRLQTLASVYRNIPGELWRFDRDWNFYAKLARISKWPDIQEKWCNTTPYRGWMSELEAEIVSLTDKPTPITPKRTKKIKPEYKILNTLTGELMTPEEYENESI